MATVEVEMGPEVKVADVGSMDDRWYEVVRGQVVEPSPLGAMEAMLASTMLADLGQFVRTKRLGRVVRGMLFRLDGAGSLQRRPDVAFLSYRRWAHERPIAPDTNALAVVPDLAIEVVSPANSANEVVERVAEYFAAGSERVWVIYPTARQVYDYRNVTSVQILGWDDTIDGGTLLPGFSITVATLFEDVVPPG